MTHQSLPYKHSSISCYRFGTGSQPVLCFHGYGESGESFRFLEAIQGAAFTFYAIELPFHGATDWQEGLDFSVADLQAIVALMPFDTTVRPMLMGYSLGGRVVLALYESRPEFFSRIILLAPDGLVMNPWYWLSTQTYIGNRLFRFTMKHPGWFFALLRGLNKTGKVNASVFKFVNAYIEDPALRRSLYQRWTALRKLRPDLNNIKKWINHHQTPVRLLYGKHDRIILPSRGERFRAGIEAHCKIDILPAGHQLLQLKYLDAIRNALNN